MSLQTTINQVISETFISTIGNLAQSIFYILAIYFGLRYIGDQIGKGIKKIPDFLEQWDKIKMKHYQINKAIEGRKL